MKRGLKAMRRPRYRSAALAMIVALTVAAALALPTGALAGVSTYCDQQMSSGGTCPPNGDSTWEHLIENSAEASGLEAESCIDEYLDPKNNGYFTGSKCVVGGQYPAKEFPEGTWGYPRAWEAGKKGFVTAQESW